MGADRLPPITRRRLLEGTAFGAAAVLLGACDGDEEQPRPRSQAEPDAAGTTESRRLAPTPACDDGDDPTPEQTEGPYYTPDTPRRRRIAEPGVAGEPLVVTGLVLATDCRPVRRALLDHWQCDGEGEYDNEGYRVSRWAGRPRSPVGRPRPATASGS